MGELLEETGDEYDEENGFAEEPDAEYWVEGGLWLFCISTCIMLCISSTSPSI